MPHLRHSATTPLTLSRCPVAENIPGFCTTHKRRHPKRLQDHARLYCHMSSAASSALHRAEHTLIEKQTEPSPHPFGLHEMSHRLNDVYHRPVPLGALRSLLHVVKSEWMSDNSVLRGYDPVGLPGTKDSG